jgi:hypothetical protein
VVLLLAQGVHPRTVMEIVGHSAIEMTINVCGHVNLKTHRRALDELDRALKWEGCAASAALSTTSKIIGDQLQGFYLHRQCAPGGIRTTNLLIR